MMQAFISELIFVYLLLMITVMAHINFLKDKKGTFQQKEYDSLMDRMNNLENLFNPVYLIPLVSLVISQQKMFFKVKSIAKKVKATRAERLELLNFLEQNKILYPDNYDLLKNKLQSEVNECDKALSMVKERLDF